MWFVVAALIVGAGAAWELTSETAGEYFAMYFIEPVDFGASSRIPSTLDSGLNTESTREIVESDSTAVLLAGVAPVAAVTTAADTPEPVATTAAIQAPAPVANPEVAALPETKAAAMPEVDANTIPFEVLLSLMGDTPHRRLDGSVFLPISTQRVFGLRTMVGTRIRVPETLEMPGRIVPNPGSNTLLQATYDGVVEAVNGKFPFVGQRVKRGQLLAYLRPTNTHIEEARLAESIQELTNHIDLARKRMARLEEVIYVRYRTSKIEELRVEIIGLQRQKDVLQKSLNRRYEIRALTDGVVSHADVAVGQHLHEGDTLFQVVDPSRLWVEAIDFEPGTSEHISNASAVMTDNRRLDLKFLGGGLSLLNQAVPLRFEILNPVPGLAVDNPVTVVVQKGSGHFEGIKVPRKSVVRTSDGRQLVWERRTAERFVSHHVSTLPIDADHVLVTSPLDSSSRIVTDGASVIDQVR